MGAVLAKPIPAIKDAVENNSVDNITRGMWYNVKGFHR
jgi:hypothetical protein